MHIPTRSTSGWRMSTAVMPHMDPQVHLNLARDFEVRRAGQEVPIAPASQRLVCFLALQAGRVHRSYISGTLWSGVDDHHASASLRSVLWRLHPLDIVDASSTHLWLRSHVVVDLRCLEERALTVLRSRAPDEVSLALARELIDVGDDILLGWYEDWVVYERERFRLIRLNALDRIGEQLIDGGRWEDALEVGLAVTRTEPLRESAQRILMRVHLMQGNVAEAIRLYRSYARALRDQLSSRPSQRMLDLLAPWKAVLAESAPEPQRGGMRLPVPQRRRR